MKTKIAIPAILILFLALWACSDYTEDFPVPAPSIVASYTFTSSTGFDPPDTISFTNTSYIPEGISGVSWLWDFGDSTTSTEANPVHIFDQEGTFSVSLTPVFEGENRVFSFEENLKFVAQLKGDTLFKEDFENLEGGVIPSDWALFNLDQGTLATSQEYLQGLNDSAWIVYRSNMMDSSMIAAATSWYEEDGLGADDWMILPLVSLGDNPILQWDAMSLTSSGNYPDSYKIWVSTTTQDPDGCMANPLVYRVVEEEAAEDRATPGKGIQNRSVNLSRYAGQDVYIGFQLMTPFPGGDRLGIDNIVIINP